MGPDVSKIGQVTRVAADKFSRTAWGRSAAPKRLNQRFARPSARKSSR